MPSLTRVAVAARAIDNRCVLTRISVITLACGLAAGCGSDAYPISNGDDSPDADPTRPDADPSRPDAAGDGGGGGGDASNDGGDGQGPTIEVISPLAGTMVRGVVTLIVRVTDADGVDPDSVAASIGGVGTISMSAIAGGTWRGSYDTVALAGLVFPTIVVRAADVPGNESQLGFQVVLDNQGPLASLDPPRVREARRNSDGALECSLSFDPIGSDAPDDGETVAQLIELRARVQDIGNSGTTTSAVYVPNAGIDDASVQVYVLDDTLRPLIVDSDGDGVCDRVNPQIVPAVVPMTSTEAAVVDLVPVASGGAAYFATSVAGDGYTGSNAACVTGADVDPPPLLCLAAEPAIRVPESTFEHAAMVYVPGPTSELACMGLAFDARASNIADGWACAAIVSRDKVGNQRVSPVLRFCVDADGAGAECGAWGTIAAPGLRPNCTGTYTIAGGVTSTPCTPPQTFPNLGATGDYELLRIDD